MKYAHKNNSVHGSISYASTISNLDDSLSVGWDGRLYDCDFNQLLDLDVTPQDSRIIFDATLDKLTERVIQIGQHCFGCTAGLGSN